MSEMSVARYLASQAELSVTNAAGTTLAASGQPLDVTEAWIGSLTQNLDCHAIKVLLTEVSQLEYPQSMNALMRPVRMIHHSKLTLQAVVCRPMLLPLVALK